jgi:hypothetical protein
MPANQPLLAAAATVVLLAWSFGDHGRLGAPAEAVAEVAAWGAEVTAGACGVAAGGAAVVDTAAATAGATDSEVETATVVARPEVEMDAAAGA